MRRIADGLRRLGWLVALLGIAVLVLATPLRVPAEEKPDTADKARTEAEKAKTDAKKALTEAEAAMAEAERAMAQAERLKAQAREEKAHAIEKMVAAGRYPEDISMTEPDTTTVAVFSHRKHTEREKLKCIECHPNVFIMKVGKNVVKKGQLTMAEMKKGRYCGNCHDGHKAFSVSDIASCKRCHPKNQ